MQFIKLTKGTDAIKIFNNFGFFKLSTESGGEPELEATPSLVYTLSSDGTYYIVGTGFTSIEAIEADTSGGTNGSGLDSTWAGGQLVIPAEHNGLPVKAIAPKAFNAVKNITEMYIYDGITNIGHTAFQCLEADGFDTTMKACRLPETLTSLGGTTSAGAGRVFWGRQGLKVINLPESIVYFPYATFYRIVANSFIMNKPVPVNQYCFASSQINSGTIKIELDSRNDLQQCFYTLNSNMDYKTSELDVIVSQNPNYSNNNPKMKYLFAGSHLRKVLFDSSIKELNGQYEANYKNMFTSANIQEVEFQLEKWQDINNPEAFGVFSGQSFVIDRMRFPNITVFNNFRIYYVTAQKPKKTFFGASSCVLNHSGESYMSPECFIKANYIDNYSQATNWTSYFANSGSEETIMRVYGDYLSGDALPTQIGTNQVYNVTWYEDDDFTTPAGITATANKEYYGKISAVV